MTTPSCDECRLFRVCGKYEGNPSIAVDCEGFGVSGWSMREQAEFAELANAPDPGLEIAITSSGGKRYGDPLKFNREEM